MQPNPSIETVLDIVPSKYHPRHKRICTSPNPLLDIGAVVGSNGITQYKVYCTECREKGGAIAYDVLRGVNTSTIKTIRTHKIAPCERCGSLDGSELHHWAPRHLFEDADEWPTSHLCRRCHMKWRRIVTPGMAANANTPKMKAA